VDNDNNSSKFESVYSHKVKAGKRRTYFFDVKKTKGEDFYITLTESTKRFNGDGYERHKIFLYKEDFNRFVEGLEETIDHIKNELMPDYDYDEYTRRNQEWEEKREKEDREAATQDDPGKFEIKKEIEKEVSRTDDSTEDQADEDMSW
jgi:hypothetical protein